MLINYAGTRELTAAHQAIELVINGDMSSSTGWTLAAGMSISGGVLVATTGTTAASFQVPTIVENYSYDTTFTISSITSPDNSFTVEVGSQAGVTRLAVGTYSEKIVCGSSVGSGVAIRASMLGINSATVDNFSVKLASGNLWDLEFIAATSNTQPKTNKKTITSLDESSQTIILKSEYFVYSVSTGTVVRGSAEYNQFIEFFSSVREGESFTFDEYGTIAIPDNPVTVKIIGREKRVRVSGDIFKFSFNMKSA